MFFDLREGDFVSVWFNSSEYRDLSPFVTRKCFKAVVFKLSQFSSLCIRLSDQKVFEVSNSLLLPPF